MVEESGKWWKKNIFTHLLSLHPLFMVGKKNKVMKEMVRDLALGMPIGLYIILILSIGLLVAGFIVPPLGIIDPSVLKAAGLILGGTWLLFTTANIPKFIESGAKISAGYGSAHIEIGRNKKKGTEVQEEKPKEE